VTLILKSFSLQDVKKSKENSFHLFNVLRVNL